MDEAKTIGANARISALKVSPGEDGAAQVDLARLEMEDVEGTLGAVSYHARELAIDGLQTRIGHVQTNAESAVLTDATIRTADDNVRLDIGQIGFPRGLAFTHGTELFAPHASLEDARFEIRDVTQLLSPRDAAPAAGGEGDGRAPDSAPDNEAPDRAPGTPDASTQGVQEPPEEPAPRSTGPVDYRFLDTLRGQLDIDLVVDVTVPWVGRRRVTHYLRIPIQDGTIDFEELEKDVHWLEGLFLDLEVVGDKLVLERDLPLVPFASKALMWWRLAPEDVPLAQYRRVHLRNLLAWEFPRTGDKPKSRSKLTLHELVFSKCSLTLETTAPAKIELGTGALIQLGGEDQVGLSEARVTGDLRYNRDRPAAPTAVIGRIGQLDATIADLPLDAATLSIDRLHIGGLDNLKLRLDGLHPRRLSGTVSRMAATNLRIQL